MPLESNLLVPGWEDEEYKAFTEKFKAKKTTDDCYTPDNVYEAVAAWVEKEYSVSRSDFVRPFFPGGDFEAHPYKPTDIVVDNPPFSILAKIKRFYAERGIRFFLFAPALTLFASRYGKICFIPCGASVTYENGAVVLTSFVTNMEPDGLVVRTAPDLFQAIKKADDENRKQDKKELPKYIYPDNIITAAMCQRWCKYGVEYRLQERDCLFIDGLEAQKAKGVSIFGNGFILGTKAAAERAAAERAAAERAAAERAAAQRWPLQETELKIIQWIDKKAEEAR
jgi:hypothetical protein